jgi:hypothetical protein
VIGGYTHGTKTFDPLVFGYYEGKDLIETMTPFSARRAPKPQRAWVISTPIDLKRRADTGKDLPAS